MKEYKSKHYGAIMRSILESTLQLFKFGRKHGFLKNIINFIKIEEIQKEGITAGKSQVTAFLPPASDIIAYGPFPLSKMRIRLNGRIRYLIMLPNRPVRPAAAL